MYIYILLIAYCILPIFIAVVAAIPPKVSNGYRQFLPKP